MVMRKDETPETSLMNKTTDVLKAPHQNFLLSTQFWFLSIILLVFVLGIRFISASSYYSPFHGEIVVELSISSTAAPKATSTIGPTATNTPTLSAVPPTTALVSGYNVLLRTGPGTNFSVVRTLKYAEQLQLLGKSSDHTWLYIKTSDGYEGWINLYWVDLAGVNLGNEFPVKTPSPAPPATIFVSGNNVNLRNGPDMTFSSIRMLNYAEKLLLLGRTNDNAWLYKKTQDGQEGWINRSLVNLAGLNLNHDDYPFRSSPPTETSTPVVLNGIQEHWIDIDLSEQMLRAYDGTDLTASFLVSTGIYKYPTEMGQYHVYAKFLSYTMTGNDYFLPDVPYTMFYSGDFSIHGTYWNHNFGTPMSHGCINMDTKEAEWLYNWSSVGTLVNVHR